MKFVICGKGGCGKSTVTTLLARQYAATGKRVIVVDTDVSNVGIHRILGAEATPDLSEYFGGRKSMMESVRAANEKDIPPGAPVLGTWTYSTIPKGYSSIKDDVQLITIGKLRDTSEGCTCSISTLARQFILGLALEENDRVIIDTEAGIEHFGRGIDKLCEAVLMVVDPSYESLCLVKKISGMADSIEVPLFFVLNKTDSSTSRVLRETIPDRDRIIGEFELDTDILEAGLEGSVFPFGHPAAATVLDNLKSRLKADNIAA
ncbi:MAG: P-loop NTPase [Desulfobacteraceae bacterium]|jgi:CO dehydrogenase maturation factor